MWPWEITRPSLRCSGNEAGRITSRRNPLLQQIRRLLTSRRARQEEGLFVGDGTKLLEEAARWYGGLETVILTDTLPVPGLYLTQQYIRCQRT